DLNGALDVSGTSTLAGAVTANAGVVVDNITIDGTEIDLSSGDLTLDVAGDIYLNADGGNILFQDGSADLMEIDANSRISLSNNDSGTSNTIFGKSAGASLDAGSNYNVFIGDAVSDATMDDATLNVGLGSSALSALTTGDKNVATGYKSLFSNTTGTYNTSIGAYALQLNTTGEKNIAIGGGALDVSDEEDHNLAIGYDALGGAIDGGEYNVAIGNYSLDANTSGYKNIAVGYDALTANTEGNRNTAVGHGSLIANTTGEYNNAFGLATLYSNTTGGSNIAIGNGALLNNTTASYNTAVGFQSLRDANRTADANAYNTAIGYQAGNTGTNDITTGDKNMLVGASTAASKAAATNQIVIGYGASGTGDNYAVIGNSDITRLYAASDGAGVLYANGTIQSSDRRIKRNIEDVSYGLNYIMSLRPVTYYKKHPRDYPQELKDKFYPDGKVREVSAEDYDKRQIGFIAQEVKEVNENMGVENNIVSIDEDGFHRMDYQKLVVPLIKAVQELSAKVDQLESQLNVDGVEASPDS
ncbi:MAG: tail fiber domain-containing protein, partial [Candidatus Marinimicrobia bacterium]|nr:tail fiber domain-containing protein [Candidatus Neomarinimicrobiota bacterium]